MDRPTTSTVSRSAVLDTGVADPSEAAELFARRLRTETDPSDVHADLAAGVPGFVVVDTRSRGAYAEAHVPGAVSLPHAEITAEAVAAIPALAGGAVAVTYCFGPHCNAAAKGALRLARLGVPAKEMIGGIDGWHAEGLPVASGSAPGAIG